MKKYEVQFLFKEGSSMRFVIEGENEEAILKSMGNDHFEFRDERNHLHRINMRAVNCVSIKEYIDASDYMLKLRLTKDR